MLALQAESQMSEPIMIVMTLPRMIRLLEQQEQPASVQAAP